MINDRTALLLARLPALRLSVSNGCRSGGRRTTSLGWGQDLGLGTGTGTGGEDRFDKTEVVDGSGEKPDGPSVQASLITQSTLGYSATRLRA